MLVWDWTWRTHLFNVHIPCECLPLVVAQLGNHRSCKGTKSLYFFPEDIFVVTVFGPESVGGSAGPAISAYDGWGTTVCCPFFGLSSAAGRILKNFSFQFMPMIKVVEGQPRNTQDQREVWGTDGSEWSGLSVVTLR